MVRQLCLFLPLLLATGGGLPAAETSKKPGTLRAERVDSVTCGGMQTCPQVFLTSPAEPAALQIQIVHGDRAVHQAGSRVQIPLVVKITGETGEAVDGAIVSFRLPAIGPGGLFANGLATDIVRTGADGAASMPPVRWNTTPGPFEIRVTAAKDAARAGLLVSQSLGEARTTSMVTVHPGAASARPRRKWILLIAGVAAGSLAAGMAVAKKSETPAGSAPTSPGLSVGTPSISIGGPK